MVKIYKQPFAHDGDTIAIPDTSQTDGKMSNADGWTVDYQLPRDDPNYKPVDRQEMNGVFKEVTESLGQVQVQGAATWSPDGTPYPINAQIYHNGKQWVALRANSVAPVEGADWSAVIPQKTVTDALANKADKATQVIAGTGLTGGGNLSANRTLAVKYATTAQAQALTAGDVVITPVTLAAAFKGSNHNISGNGYQKLPSGLIIQWGGGAASNAGAALSWPIAFPNGIFSAVAMHNGGDPWGAGVITATSQNKTRAIFHNSGSVTPISMRYIVIGY